MKKNQAVSRMDRELPAGWRWARLGEVCHFRHGGTPSKGNEEYGKGTIPWVSPKDMRGTVISDTIDHISEKAVHVVLWNKDGSNGPQC